MKQVAIFYHISYSFD